MVAGSFDGLRPPSGFLLGHVVLKMSDYQKRQLLTIKSGSVSQSSSTLGFGGGAGLTPIVAFHIAGRWLVAAL